MAFKGSPRPAGGEEEEVFFFEREEEEVVSWDLGMIGQLPMGTELTC